MLCQKCHKNEANIHISGAADSGGTHWHLCSSCAVEELTAKASAKAVDIGKFLQFLADHVVESAEAGAVGDEAEMPEREVKVTCPGCGLTDVELENSRRFGCARCYEIFAESIGPWLEGLHRDVIHRGVRPGASERSSGPDFTDLSADALRLELERAIAAEAYEHAAELRDTIRKHLRKTGG